MWTFRCPEIVFGEDALDRLELLKGERAFVITDHNIVQLGLLAPVTARLYEAGLQYRLFEKVEPDPALETILAIRDELLEFEPQWVIGLGGGSCLDAAKAAWFLYERPQVDPEAITPFETFSPHRKAQMIAISTTSGTGADASMGTVITLQAEQRKLTLVSPELMPDIAIVDPSLVVQLPPQITADTGMDVLSHALESFITPWHTSYTDALALEAMRLVFTYLPRAYVDGKDTEAREAMHNAATMGGIALSNASLGIAHSLAHAFGGLFHTPHGRTVGMFLPYTLRYAANENPERLAAASRFLTFSAAHHDGEAVQVLFERIHQLQQTLNQPRTIPELHPIGQVELEGHMKTLVENAVADAFMLTTPRVPGNKETEQLFRYAFTGQEVNF